MALYLVVHHPRDPERPWANQWADDSEDLLLAITTTAEIGRLCQEARAAGERVFVHRCALGESPPTICCNVDVLSVDAVDRRTSLVRFRNQAVLGAVPPLTPSRGQNWYRAAPAPPVG